MFKPYFALLSSSFKEDLYDNFVKDERWRYFAKGLLATLEIAFFAALIGIAIGTVVAAVRSTYDKNREAMAFHKGPGYYLFGFFNLLCKIYLAVIRGTPVVVQLMIMYFVIMVSTTNGVLVAIIAFGINSGAYVAEIMRAGIMSIDNGQFEAGRSLGFTYPQTMIHIVLPQAFKNVLPTLLNEFIALLKETSVAGYVGIMDLTRSGNIVRGVTFSAFIPLIAVAFIYLIIVLLLTWAVGRIERRLRVSER